MVTDLEKINKNDGNSYPMVRHEPTQLCPRLNAFEQQIILASNHKKIRELEMADIENSVNDAIPKALVKLGHKRVMENTDELEIMISDVAANLKRYYPTITLEDFQIAMNSGSLGEYTKEDEITVVTVTSIHKWIKAYKKEKAALVTTQTNYEKKLDKDKRIELSPTQQKQFMAIQSKRALEEFKQNSHYFDLGNIVYDFLFENNILNLPDEKRLEIWHQATEAVKKANSIHMAKDAVERLERKKLLDEIKLETPEAKKHISIQAKRLALNSFFS